MAAFGARVHQIRSRSRELPLHSIYFERNPTLQASNTAHDGELEQAYLLAWSRVRRSQRWHSALAWISVLLGAAILGVALSVTSGYVEARWAVNTAASTVASLSLLLGFGMIAGVRLGRWSYVKVPEHLLLISVWLVDDTEYELSKWSSLEHRKDVMFRVEVLAKCYEKLAGHLGVSDKGVASRLDAWTRGLAAGTRETMMSIAGCEPHPPEGLAGLFAQHVSGAYLSHWGTLPTGEPPARRSRSEMLTQATWATIGTLALGGALTASIALASEGPGALVASSILGVVGLLALGRAGFNLAALKEAKESFDAFRK